jgi:flagellar basal body-associated protein FliL
MNRGIFVNRCSPDIEELKQIAIGICKNDEKVINVMEKYLPSLANAYIDLCEQTKKHREFFGLRDFYSLVKMIY